MKALKKLPFFLAFILLFSCDTFDKDETAVALKEALTVGAKYALNVLGTKDGFYLDMAVKIGLPQDAANFIKQASSAPVVGIAIKALEQELILSINRAAEASIEGVIPIVVEAITSISIQDATSILFSNDNRAATEYLKGISYSILCNICEAVIGEALNKKIVGDLSAQGSWEKLTGYYNQVANIPGLNIKPIETNLTLYTTQKALDGVFLKVGDEEVKIRTDVNARISDLLRKVFGRLD
jgi:hypothetical protein